MVTEENKTAALPLHLFEFGDLGFFSARDKEHAFQLAMEHTGCTAEDLQLDDDFKRQVPADEEIDVCAEESWGDPRERMERITNEGGRPYSLWRLKLTAGEWANHHPNADEPEQLPGYAFGGLD